MNNVCFLGRLARANELKYSTPKSKKDEPIAILRNTIAINRGKEEVDFVPFVAFGGTAELIAQYTEKGSMLGISGRMQSGSYEDEDGDTVYTLETVVGSITFTPNAKKEEEEQKGGKSKKKKK